MPMKPPSRWTLLLIFVLLLIAAFLPEMVGAGWHLVHGNSAHYREWNIPIPTGWFAMQRGESLAVERMLRFALWQQAPTVVFLPVHVTGNYKFNPGIWQSEQVKIQAERGYQLAGVRQIVMAEQPGYCWEFVRPHDLNRWWVTCIVPNGWLSADFTGARAYIPAFYSMLPRITHAPRHT